MFHKGHRSAPWSHYSRCPLPFPAGVLILPPTPVSGTVLVPCSAGNIAPPPVSAGNVALPPISAEDVGPPPVLAENVAPLPCSAEVITPPSGLTVIVSPPLGLSAVAASSLLHRWSFKSRALRGGLCHVLQGQFQIWPLEGTLTAITEQLLLFSPTISCLTIPMCLLFFLIDWFSI